MTVGITVFGPGWLRIVSFAAVAMAAAGGSARAAAPGRTEGVLVFPGDHPWGVYYEPGFSWEWARSEKQSRYRLLSADRVQVPAFSPGGGTADDEISAARAMGVTGPVHLVEAEAKTVRGPHMTVSSLRMIEGTQEVPWTLSAKLDELAGLFGGVRLAQKGALETRYRRAEKTLRADPGGTILRPLEPFETVIYRPSWLAGTRRLVVFFAYKKQGGFWIKSRRAANERHTRYAPAPPERGVSFAAAVGARFVVDAAGGVVSREVFPPERFDEAPWAQRVLRGMGPSEDIPADPGGVEVSIRADREVLRPGERVVLTIVAANRRAVPVWTNPRIICTGSWDFIVRDKAGNRVRVDDRDAMGCPGGGILQTAIAPGATATIEVSWDGRVRPHPGSSRAAPPGRYEFEATVMWADREGTPNARGPHAFVTTARMAVVLAGSSSAP